MGQKPYEELSFRDDFMFCKILGRDKALCKEILELVLEYTFENICREDPSLTLRDESVKIFLCTEGTANDVSEQLLMFLRYVAGDRPEGVLPERIEREVCKARNHEEWRREYMTLQMRDQENQEIGKEIGIEIGKKLGVGLGEKNRAVRTAETMLAEQEPVEKIVLYTGLSREEIEELMEQRMAEQ